MVDAYEGTASTPPPPPRRRARFGRVAVTLAVLPGLALALDATFPQPT